jgi:hypothetical protein
MVRRPISELAWLFLIACCGSGADSTTAHGVFEVLQEPNVVFPSGRLVDEYDDSGFARPESSAFIYYGAADTCVGLATTTVGELVATCRD